MCTYDTWVKDLPSMILTCTHLNSSYSVVCILFVNAFYSLMCFAFVSLLCIVNFFRYNRKGTAVALVYIFGDVVVSSFFYSGILNVTPTRGYTILVSLLFTTNYKGYATHVIRY